MIKNDLYDLSAYQFELPKDRIAQKPCSPRDSSRLMIVDRATGNISEMVFRELVDFLQPGDSIVLNNTKVIPARLIGRRTSGFATELFLISSNNDGTWNVMAKPGKKLKNGDYVEFGDGFHAQILNSDNGIKKVRFHCDIDLEEALEIYGQVPLPPYIVRDQVDLEDKITYQTVFASKSGAVAAPTAGLHFTKQMFIRLDLKGIEQIYVTLHVGLGTFLPVKVQDIRNHFMHEEKYMIDAKTAQSLNAKDKSKRQVCVGTTCCRVLESAISAKSYFTESKSRTDIFIYPGYNFKYVDCLLTNFHLPGSTLLMLVSSFAGYELIMEAYAKAIKDGFRFFSYGDAMLII